MIELKRLEELENFQNMIKDMNDEELIEITKKIASELASKSDEFLDLTAKSNVLFNVKEQKSLERFGYADYRSTDLYELKVRAAKAFCSNRNHEFDAIRTYEFAQIFKADEDNIRKWLYSQKMPAQIDDKTTSKKVYCYRRKIDEATFREIHASFRKEVYDKSKVLQLMFDIAEVYNTYSFVIDLFSQIPNSPYRLDVQFEVTPDTHEYSYLKEMAYDDMKQFKNNLEDYLENWGLGVDFD